VPGHERQAWTRAAPATLLNHAPHTPYPFVSSRPCPPSLPCLAWLTVTAAALGSLPAQSLPDRVLIGYWQNWVGSPQTVRLANVPNEYDVIDVSFAVPSPPGSASMQFSPDPGIYSSQSAFIADVQAKQAQGKKVLISIGGASAPVQLQSAADVQTFVTSMLQIVNTYGFDGIDLDLEGASLSLAPGDADFRAPTTPVIVNMIAATTALGAHALDP
jgi:chitinase